MPSLPSGLPETSRMLPWEGPTSVFGVGDYVQPWMSSGRSQSPWSPQISPWKFSSIMGMGQNGQVIPLTDTVTKGVTKFFKDASFSLIVSGAVIGYLGAVVMEDSPFGPIVMTAGGFLLAAGILPIIISIL